MRRLLVALAFFAACVVALSFLLLPLVALFTHVPPGTLVRQLSNPVVGDALVVSAKTSLAAQLVILLYRDTRPPTCWQAGASGGARCS